MKAHVSTAMADDEAGSGIPTWTSPEEILNQLDRLVSSVHFRNSKRYPAFLRYIVEQTLLGHAESLKERTLGVEVFGRPADYDTNADPVVRITAGEIRKRLAQYYQSPEHEQELRFHLPLGSYAPQVLPPPATGLVATTAHGEERALTSVQGLPTPLPDEAAAHPVTTLFHEHEETAFEQAAAEPPPLLERKAPAQAAWRRLLRPRWLIVCGLMVLAAGAVLLATELVRQREDAGLSFFWGPIFRSKEPAMIVLGVHSFDRNGNDLSPFSYAHLPLGEQTALSSMIRSDMVPVSDVVSYNELASLLTRRALPFRTQSAAETTLEEFGHGPLILLGGFDNMWTMRLTSSLRYRLVADGGSVHAIQDSEHAAVRWAFDNAQSALSNSRDYAIVARFFDPEVEQHVLLVAGIGKSGTEAAAEFVTNKRALQSWLQSSPAVHRDNVEIVLETDTVEGKHGPPHVVASYRW